MAPIDLDSVPVVDNHCHSIYPPGARLAPADWRARLTESADPLTRGEHVTTSLFYQRLLRELAHFLGRDGQVDLAADEDALIGLRADPGLVRRLFTAANIETLLVDTGFPPPDQTLSCDDFGAVSGCRTRPVLRVEVVMQELIAAYATLSDVEEALRERLRDARAEGCVALKSIVAYRGGLDIRVWPRHGHAPSAEESFARVRRAVARTGGPVRLAEKPLLDTLLHVVFAESARQELPVQFHTGYGDHDADMLLANPLHLRTVLEEPNYRAMPVVLLHASYPYTRQGAYLAALYDRVYLDLSYGIPFLGYGEMVAFTRAAIGVAPLSKLLYSSDGAWLPEIHWTSARHGRRVLGQVLGEAVALGDLSPAVAERAGAAVLRGNAVGLYRLDGTPGLPC